MSSENKGGACTLCGAQQPRLLVTKSGYDVVECTNCRLVFVANPPTVEQLATFYSFESGYHEGFAHDDGSAVRHEIAAREHCNLVEQVVKPGAILDIGCSAGFFLTEAVSRGWRAEGVEYSADSATIAIEKRGLTVHVGRLQALNLPSESFDVITMWDVIEHLPEPLEALMEARRLLKPGGILALETPNVDGLFPRASLLATPLLRFWRHPEPPSHLFQFSKDTIGRALRATGYDVVRIDDARIPIGYSFGSARNVFRSAKYALYCLAFIPLAVVGPWVSRGDTMRVLARKGPGPGARRPGDIPLAA